MADGSQGWYFRRDLLERYFTHSLILFDPTRVSTAKPETQENGHAAVRRLSGDFGVHPGQL